MPPYLLVVESDPALQQRIGDTLREASYELSTEADAAWAKRSLLIRAPDAVILDTHLADGSGFAVADALRNDPDTERVPIFFLATRHHGMAHQAETRRRFAPAEYLPAPVDLDSLLALVLETVPPRDPVAPVPVTEYPAGGIADTAQKRERRVVEQTARALADEELERRGSITVEPFAHVLQGIFAERLTGALLLVRDGTKKIVYFVEGYPVSVRSNALAECLGQILLASKLISQNTLQESVRRMTAERRHQGAILVEMGALSPFNLSRALVAQMEAKFYEIFSWRTGDFAFKEGKLAPDEPVQLEKTTAGLILEGIRRHYDQERMRTVLGAFAGQFLAPSRDPRRRLQDITADPAERQFIESLDGSLRLEEALASAPVPIYRARLLLVAMSEAGMLEPARGGASGGSGGSAGATTTAAERRRKATREMGGPDTTETRDHAAGAGASFGRLPIPPAHRPGGLADTRDPVQTAEHKGREELAAVLETMRGQTHFEVLGLDADSKAAEVDTAHQALAREYHPDRFRFRPEELRTMAMKIFDRLNEAQAVLRDGARRRRYLTQLERERLARLEESTGLSLRGDAPDAAAEQVYFRGVEHLRARRHREAVKAFRQAASLSPGTASYRGALGWALFRQAPTEPEALQAGLIELRRAVEMDPANPWVRISLGRFFAETGSADEAIAEFEVALRLNPGLGDIEEEIRRLRGQT